MPFDLIDLETCEPYGPFTTHAQAKESAQRSGFKGYSIWENGVRVELFDPLGLGEQPIGEVG